MQKLPMLLTALLVVPLGAYSQQAPLPEQGSPPTDLIERDGFFTANSTPPSTENFEIHVVVAGDTLWNLAEQYLNNAFLWPQLWETNEHIVNPHWIYPGDPVLIRPVTLITEEVAPPPSPPTPAPAQQPPAPVRLPVTPQLTREATPPPATPLVLDLPEVTRVSEVKASDLYCSGFITTRQVAPDLNVIAKFPPAESVIAIETEYVYLGQGSNSGIAVGDLFTAIRRTRNVSSTREQVGSLGLHFLEIGQVRVVMAQPAFSLARVIHACDGIELGDAVVPFQEIDFPELPANRPFSAMMPSTGKTAGAIALTRDVMANTGSSVFRGTTTVPGVDGGRLNRISRGVAAEGQIVYIDLGNRDGVQAGDLFLIYRPHDTPLYQLSGEAARLLTGQREVIGELVVLKVEERSAAALITFSSRGVSAGDSIELR